MAPSDPDLATSDPAVPASDPAVPTSDRALPKPADGRPGRRGGQAGPGSGEQTAAGAPAVEPGAPDDPARTGSGGVVRVRLDLAYDGSGFAGFARQRDQDTVQGRLETVLSRLLDQFVVTVAAGRTDRGVHALAQVVHLDVDLSVPRAAMLCLGRGPRAGQDPREPRAGQDLPELRARLDRQVGPAIVIWQASTVGPGFHARFAATGRRYRYRLVDDLAAADPRRRHDRWWVADHLDVPAMRTALRLLVGEHDFASFCRQAEGRTTVRRLDDVAVHRPSPGRIDVRLDGSAFCHQQVRSIIGCLVEVGRGRQAPEWLGEVLAARDRSAAARVAPPEGLTLERVSYGRRWPAAPPVAVRRALRGRAAASAGGTGERAG